MSILSHFPYPEARPVQAEALQTLEKNWSNYDVFVLVAPTAFGKTAFSRTLVDWGRGDVSIIAPTNQLVDQFQEEFPEACTYKKADLYKCIESTTNPPLSCATMPKYRDGKRCKGCPYGRAFRDAVILRRAAVTNYHMLFSRKLHKSILVADEAHNLIPVTADLAKIRLWQHKWGYPDEQTRPALLAWTKKELAQPRIPKGRKKKLEFLLEAISYENPQYVIQWKEDLWTAGGVTNEYGDTVRRGQGIELPCIDLLPVDIRDLDQKKWFFGDTVKKIVLMSATISRKDIEQLGLSRRRVLYIQCASPIPAERRPVEVLSIASVSRGNLESATEKIARYIEDTLLPRHTNEKGLIHATYEQAGILRRYLSSSRFIYHTVADKSVQYNKFRAATPESGAVLVASGMYEGIDLPEDFGRWQVVTKVPWKSLGDHAIRHLAARDPDWYLWETLKVLIQSCGRICRTPDDYGITYILDGSVEKLLDNGYELLPEWFRNVLREGVR